MAEAKKTTGNTKADPRGKVTGHLIVKNYEHGTEVDLDCGIADAMFMMVIAAKRLDTFQAYQQKRFLISVRQHQLLDLNYQTKIELE